MATVSLWRILLLVRGTLELAIAPTWRRKWHPTPVLLLGKPHGWRSLVGCSPWGLWGSDRTEWLHFHFSLSCIGEGNGNPLQRSCLENSGMGKPGGLLSMGSHRVRHDWSNLAAALPPTNPCYHHIDAAYDCSIYYQLSNPFFLCSGQQASTTRI